MRIAIFADSFYPSLGGLEDSVAILARALGERGYWVDIYAPKFSRLDFVRRGWPVQEIDLGQNVQVYRFSILTFT